MHTHVHALCACAHLDALRCPERILFPGPTTGSLGRSTTNSEPRPLLASSRRSASVCWICANSICGAFFRNGPPLYTNVPEMTPKFGPFLEIVLPAVHYHNAKYWKMCESFPTLQAFSGLFLPNLASPAGLFLAILFRYNFAAFQRKCRGPFLTTGPFLQK